MTTFPSIADQPELRPVREVIKTAIQVATDSEGRLLYVIPPGVAGMYADSVLRALVGFGWGPVPAEQIGGDR